MATKTPHKILVLIAAVALVASACTGSSGGAAAEQTTPTSSVTPTTELITSDPLPDIDPAPNAPSGIEVVRSGDGIVELGWDASRDETVLGYEVSRVSPAGASERFEVAGAGYIDEAVENGEIYTYLVKAIGTGGESEASDILSVQVGVDNNAPKSPGRPELVESAAGISLSWDGVSDISGIENYIVTRTIGEDVVELDAGTTTSFFDDVEEGQVVTYTVRAVDRAENESDESRATTVLSGFAPEGTIVVVSMQAEPENTASTARLERDLLEAGFTISWFEDSEFDANITESDDIVLLLGDVEGEGFDWNIFGTDTSVIGFKSMFVQAGGITEDPPKLDRLAQLDYLPPGKAEREVAITNTGRPKPTVYIPPNEILPSFETWARPVWSDDIAVAGLIPKGGELANEKPAPGCRAFFPGNSSSLDEQTEDAWALMYEFILDIRDTCSQ